MPFEVIHICGIEEVLIRNSWYDENGTLKKAGIILELNPYDLPEVAEGQEFIRVFISKDVMEQQRI